MIRYDTMDSINVRPKADGGVYVIIKKVFLSYIAAHNYQIYVISVGTRCRTTGWSGDETSSSAIAERLRDVRVTTIRKIAKWNFWATFWGT